MEDTVRRDGFVAGLWEWGMLWVLGFTDGGGIEVRDLEGPLNNPAYGIHSVLWSKGGSGKGYKLTPEIVV